MFREWHEGRQRTVLPIGGFFEELACFPLLCGMDHLARILYPSDKIKGSQNNICGLYRNCDDCNRFESVLYTAK